MSNKKLLINEYLSETSARVLLIIGIVSTSYSLASVQSLSAAGAFQYVIICFGLLSLILGISDLLPRKHSGIIITLRIAALALIGILLYIVSFILIFWWGMQ